MTINELLAAAGLNGTDELPIWNGATQKVTAQQLADAVKTLANLQGELTFDNAPTAGSINPVTSDGINTAIQQSTAEALDGLKFLRLLLTANTPKTITVSNSARAILFFVASYASCCGEAAFAHYGSGHCDGPIWFREATGITINTSTDGRIVLTATQNTYCSVMLLSGTYTE